MSQVYRFLNPLDVLFMRGNHLFGAAGQHGAALMPPWPSVMAGALRSRMLVDAGHDFEAFQAGQAPVAEWGEILGTPSEPGSFELGGLWLAQKVNGEIERFHAAPADLVMLDGKLKRLRPRLMPLLSSSELPMLAILQADKAAKPETGWLLNEAGWQAWLADQPLDAEQHTRHIDELYALDERLGIALDRNSHTAADGAIYTAQAIAMQTDASMADAATGAEKSAIAQTGFVCSIRGASESLIPADGLLRLGGDGRGAAVESVRASNFSQSNHAVDFQKKFLISLVTPGIFENGWKIAGVDQNNVWHGPDGCTARLVCAVVNRGETVSGWDLANWCPKSAQRMAPAGSIYWFDEFNGDPATLGKLAENGLWDLPGQADDRRRRAEGFNNVAVASWN